MPRDDIGCVVVSIRDAREFIVLETPSGPVTVEIRVQTPSRARAVIRAPRSIQIRRQKRADAPEEQADGA